jgi:imidazolonepropionase-like amidohydrolase
MAYRFSTPSGRTGLQEIDAHTHLTGEGTSDWRKDSLDQMQQPIPEQALQSAVYARRTLMAGFTTVRDLGSGDLLDVGLRNAINRGLVPGPRMLVAVNGLGATPGLPENVVGMR